MKSLVDEIKTTCERGVKLTRAALRPINDRLRRDSVPPKWSLVISPSTGLVICERLPDPDYCETLATFQTRAVLSAPAAAIESPSGENATDMISPVCW